MWSLVPSKICADVDRKLRTPYADFRSEICASLGIPATSRSMLSQIDLRRARGLVSVCCSKEFNAGEVGGVAEHNGTRWGVPKPILHAYRYLKEATRSPEREGFVPLV